MIFTLSLKEKIKLVFLCKCMHFYIYLKHWINVIFKIKISWTLIYQLLKNTPGTPTEQTVTYRTKMPGRVVVFIRCPITAVLKNDINPNLIFLASSRQRKFKWWSVWLSKNRVLVDILRTLWYQHYWAHFKCETV